MPPEDGRLNLAAVVPPAEQGGHRHDRPSLIGFLVDRESEEALREGLAEATSETLDIRRGGIRAAIATMQKFATPRVLVVDIAAFGWNLVKHLPEEFHPAQATWPALT